MTLHRYSSLDKSAWDDFVRNSKNGTFLFERDYMDYHSDRFVDHSLLYADDKGRLLAVLPANEVRETGDYYSHRGLTYGGLVLSRRAHATDVEACLTMTAAYLREQGFKHWYYKPVPTIYHQLPSQEEEYFLWRMGAQMEGCNLSCTLDLRLDQPMTADASRRHRHRVGLQSGMQLIEGGKDLPAEEVLRRFWPIMEENMMQRYGAKPVHTLDEMLLLQRRFPKNIRCYLVNDASAVSGCQALEVNDPSRDLAGEVLFVSRQVAHAQYGHCNAEGRQRGALDFLYLSLIERYTDQESGIRYFDFGTSNEDGGRYLNESLIAQKEGFGGRGIAYKTYLLTL